LGRCDLHLSLQYLHQTHTQQIQRQLATASFKHTSLCDITWPLSWLAVADAAGWCLPVTPAFSSAVLQLLNLPLLLLLQLVTLT
jgi:hypothetical protein